MRYPLLLLFVFCIQFCSFAQTSRMTNPEVAREYSTSQQATTVFPLLQKAERQLQVLDFEEAFFTLENAVAQNPYSAEALMARAIFKKRIGMNEESRIDYNLANKLNPYINQLYGYDGNQNLLPLLAFVPEQSLKNLEPAQKFNYYFQFIDNQSPQTSIQGELYNDLVLTIDIIEDNQLDVAEMKVDSLLEEFPESALLSDLKGLIYLKKENFPQAKKYFKEAIVKDPNFAIGWYNLGVSHLNTGDLNESKAALDKAIELETSLTKAYFERAKLFKQMGNKKAAITDYNTVINKSGDFYPKAYLNRALTKKMAGDFNGALKDLNLVIAQSPQSADLYKNRGNLYLLFGLVRKAIDDYTIAIQLDPNYAEAHFNRSMAHFKIYDMISGCRDLRQSIELDYQKAIEVEQYFCY